MTPQRVKITGDLFHRVVPEGAVPVVRPSRWGNPHRVGACSVCRSSHTAAEAVALYAADLLAGRLSISVDDVRRELAGRDLACWCAPNATCHADVLLNIDSGQLTLQESA